MKELSLAKAGMNGYYWPASRRCRHSSGWYSTITASGAELANLDKQSALTELSLVNAGLNDKSLVQLPKLPALKRLVLDGNDIRGTGLTSLRDRPELIDLSLGCPTLGDLSAKNLAELHKSSDCRWRAAA